MCSGVVPRSLPLVCDEIGNVATADYETMTFHSAEVRVPGPPAVCSRSKRSMPTPYVVPAGLALGPLRTLGHDGHADSVILCCHVVSSQVVITV